MTKRDKALTGKVELDTPRLPENVADAVSREIWKLYHLARTGKMDVQKATRLTFILSALGRNYEMSKFEPRLRALEREGAL